MIRENNSQLGVSYKWYYDDAGNILKREEYAYTTGTLGAVLDTANYTYGDATWGDLLTQYNGLTLQYDDIGNLTSDSICSYTWEHGRQLASISNGTTTWTYTYDANGMRIGRTNGTDTFSYIYNGSLLSHMTKGNNTLYFTYDAAGMPLTVNLNGTTYYYVTNLQGDVMTILNSDGYEVVRYIYDAWGHVEFVLDDSENGLGSINSLCYRGYVYYQETGLYYLQSRYYNPTWGRFISADRYVSTEQGLTGYNMFAYCNNNPVMLVDPTGEFGFIALGIIVAGIIGGVVAAASTATSGGTVEEVILSAVIGAAVAAGTAAVAATSLGVWAVAGISAGIGAGGEILSQGVEYMFHKDDADYSYNLGASATKVVYAGVIGALGGAVSKGINNVFLSSDGAGVFVSGVAGAGIGGVDFGIRKLLSLW